jgi:hypothetical protein
LGGGSKRWLLGKVVYEVEVGDSEGERLEVKKDGGRWGNGRNIMK